ncbi:acyl-CoA oxidase [Punctularia strigosozonata HHB-11173 SS5]|uniref:acyl-CoA oxidase n=1 Tax=Punctularia strigosozonata (strain HHB-11173) TaxID=741275 RepID=UPI0004417605|nr:acyl-CoA oxidase [Punctularia strigosozonata HHB-11173 SS5]EIN05643.1 acyl-CoA oxidase [Punctularia strigosozonata HHB-11173 SS5]
MWPSQSLLSSDLYNKAGPSTPPTPDARHQAERGYLRAEAIGRAYGMTIEDVATCSNKFWDMHKDPVLALDASALTIMTIHYNLCMGTISSFLPQRPDLRPLLKSLSEFKTLGQFCLTEVGHGLDAYNLGTTATLLPNGNFELNSPTAEDAKCMPPTSPVLGRPCVAVVFAQLVVGGERRGIRPFIVRMNDGYYMSKGITAREFPTRHGAAPVPHCITSFNRVQLPPSALLGKLSVSVDPHSDFLSAIGRIGVGTLCLSSTAVPYLQVASTVAYKYSLRRHVGSPAGKRVPILSFQTQELPVYTAVAQSYVLDALSRYSVKHFQDPSLDPRARHGVATCLKAAMMSHAQASHYELSERCGAQGLFGHNQIIQQLAELRGMCIAEGDTLVLSIRLANELILERYALPAPRDPTSLLAKHEAAVFAEYKDLARRVGHRSPEFSSLVLTRCRAMVEAISHRMAYEAALADRVPQTLVDLYVSQCVKADLAWYVEAGLVTRDGAARMEAAALEAARPNMAQWVEGMGVGAYVCAPITDDRLWAEFVQSLPVHRPRSDIIEQTGIVEDHHHDHHHRIQAHL